MKVTKKALEGQGMKAVHNVLAELEKQWPGGEIANITIHYVTETEYTTEAMEVKFSNVDNMVEINMECGGQLEVCIDDPGWLDRVDGFVTEEVKVNRKELRDRPPVPEKGGGLVIMGSFILPGPHPVV